MTEAETKPEGTGAAKPEEPKKTPEEEQAEKAEELKKQQEEATQQLEALLKSSNPKNLGQGLKRGAGNIIGGALGAAGIVVLAPTAGLAVGAKEGGILGGIVGLTGGAVIGVLGGAVVAVAGKESKLMTHVAGTRTEDLTTFCVLFFRSCFGRWSSRSRSSIRAFLNHRTKERQVVGRK
jgi:hypothetical protein